MKFVTAIHVTLRFLDVYMLQLYFFLFFSAVDCGSPPSVNGVLGTVSRTEYLDTAMVTCTVGYTRFGLTTQLTCNASSATATTGVWTGTNCTGK